MGVSGRDELGNPLPNRTVLAYVCKIAVQIWQVAMPMPLTDLIIGDIIPMSLLTYVGIAITHYIST